MNKREQRRAQRAAARAARETARARRAGAPRRPLVKRQRAKAAPVPTPVWADSGASGGTLLGVLWALLCALYVALFCVGLCRTSSDGSARWQLDGPLWLGSAVYLGPACVVGRMAQKALLPRWRLSMAPDGLVLTSRLGRSRTVPWPDITLAEEPSLPADWPEQVRYTIGRRASVYITVTPRTAPFIAKLRRVVGRQGRVNWLDDAYLEVPDTALSLAHLTGEEADADRALSLAEPPVERTNGA